MVDLSKFKPGTWWKHPGEYGKRFFIGFDKDQNPIFQHSDGDIDSAKHAGWISYLVPYTEPRSGRIERYAIAFLSESGAVTYTRSENKSEIIQLAKLLRNKCVLLAIVDCSNDWKQGDGLHLLDEKEP